MHWKVESAVNSKINKEQLMFLLCFVEQMHIYNGRLKVPQINQISHMLKHRLQSKDEYIQYTESHTLDWGQFN